LTSARITDRTIPDLIERPCSGREAGISVDTDEMLPADEQQASAGA
jgi:hypothetical protein